MSAYRPSNFRASGVPRQTSVPQNRVLRFDVQQASSPVLISISVSPSPMVLYLT